MKNFTYIFLMFAIPLSLNAYTFTRTLSVGSEGLDVQELQKYLNMNSDTQVAASGPGSKGNESTYFGEKTKQAVIRLQNLYAPLILFPAGLSLGTGFVGNGTISFLNNIQGFDPSDQNEQPSENEPVVENVTPLELHDGDTITITGKNFSNKNTIILGFESRYDYVDIKSTNNGTKIEIKYDSSIQEPFDKKFKELDARAKKAVLDTFPKVPVAVSVINDDNVQSNFKVINFNLK